MTDLAIAYRLATFTVFVIIVFLSCSCQLSGCTYIHTVSFEGRAGSCALLTLYPLMLLFLAYRCRRKTLKYINSRTVLIAICALVVIECACVLAELMVDLQGIKCKLKFLILIL